MKKILIVGPGLIGRRHIDIVEKSDESVVCGVVSHSGSFEKHGSSFPNLNIYLDFIEAILIERPDGVIIASPNDTHDYYLRLCAKYDLPVLLEKPALVDVDEYEKFVDDFGTVYGKEKVLVGHHRVHSAQLSKARSIVQSGKIGRVVGFSGRAAFYKPDDYFLVAPWRTKRPGGGPILINLIHEVQTMRLLVGDIENLNGFASSANRNFEVEDSLSLSVNFSSGALGTFFLTDSSVSPFSWELTSGENPAYPRFPNINCYEIFGTHGTLTIPDLKIYYQNHDNRSWWKDIETDDLIIPFNDPLEAQFNHFLDVINGRILPIVDLESGIENVRVVSKIFDLIRDT